MKNLTQIIDFVSVDTIKLQGFQEKNKKKEKYPPNVLLSEGEGTTDDIIRATSSLGNHYQG